MLMSSSIGGLLYQTWQPNQEVEGVTVFIRDLERRGPDNLRKKIYVSAVTPDLYAPVYSAKAKAFLDSLFDNSNAGQPLMACYNDNFFDFYWDLHLGLKGSDVPKEVRDFGESFIAALAYGDFTLRVVYENYMNARKLRAALNEWINARLKDIASGKAPNSQQTMAWYWIKNGELGENFRERDVVFECMHNLIAMGQYGFALHTFMEKLEEDQGDPVIRAVFKKTMESDYDQAGGAVFTPLDRFVMELFRTSNVNPGSVSSVKVESPPPERGAIRTLHQPTSLDPRHWEKPEEFNPERYLSVPASHKADASECQQSGLARCPFESVPFRVKDGRNAEITNSAFGAVYAEVDGKPLPLCDYAGYAPFGFGYRRCAGELLTIEVFKDFFRKVWKEKLVFQRLKSITPKKIPVGLQLVTDDIGFSRKS